MLSLAWSRYKSVATLGFLLSHGLGALLGTMYSHKTPDLYPSNAHYRLGWVLTWIAVVYFLCGEFRSISRMAKRLTDRIKREGGRQTIFALSAKALEEQNPDSSGLLKDSRLSSDIDNNLEPCEESVAGHSVSSNSSLLCSSRPAYGVHNDEEQTDGGLSGRPQIPGHRKSTKAQRSCASNAFRLQAQKLFSLIHSMVGRLLLILGFTALCTGIATFGRFFVSLNDPSRPEQNELSLHRRAKTC